MRYRKFYKILPILGRYSLWSVYDRSDDRCDHNDEKLIIPDQVFYVPEERGLLGRRASMKVIRIGLLTDHGAEPEYRDQYQ